ncbi:methionine/alanine import family NSS transporter small subunit [Gulosibacter sp. ACHW.36C]|uniref:Methionine/alanine import family NSS transporter small subunit n=1 Tax=Gulosibacter sediminis TaxID=1729695 RepID=A0ABY4N0T3_9MICO|nr:methionine/alanine import family NSS transporter small subunit [Gulosibacter sediminis]UQN15874.1 methionine/alanine import family NSS transporter small subunit [Gulosibacter sediminis]
MSGEAITMMVVAIVVIWGGMVGAFFNLRQRGTDGDD